MSHQHHHPSLHGRSLFLSIFLNTVITVAQLIGGFISGSLALISDAVHNFSDVISLLISYIANVLANRKKQTKKYTFGYKRAEIIAAFINAVTLIGVAVILAFEAVKRFSKPEIHNTNLIIWLALLGIVVNGLSVFILKNDAKGNLNIKTAYLHLLADMLTSIAVLVGGILMKYFKVYWVDALLTIGISIYLVVISWNILVTSLKILMLFTPKHLNINEIENEILKITSIRNIHHVHIWQLNEYDFHFEAHLEFKENVSLSVFDNVSEQIENLLQTKFNINHCTLQPEFKRSDSKDIIKQD